MRTSNTKHSILRAHLSFLQKVGLVCCESQEKNGVVGLVGTGGARRAATSQEKSVNEWPQRDHSHQNPEQGGTRPAGTSREKSVNEWSQRDHSHHVCFRQRGHFYHNGNWWDSSAARVRKRMVWWDSSRCDESGINGRSATNPTMIVGDEWPQRGHSHQNPE